MTKLLKICITAGILTASIPCASFAELVIIANPTLSVTSLSREQINRIYLGKTKFLPSGAKVIPVDQGAGSASRSTFYSDILNKTETEMKSYWSRIIFNGQGNPPLQETDDKSVKDLVAKNPNCIGYIDSSAIDSSVKVIYPK